MRNSSTSVQTPDERPVRAAALAVAAQAWPLLSYLGLLQLAALIWLAVSGSSAPVELAWWFLKTAVFGLVGSFILHETAHVIALRRISTVTGITIERTMWRVSVVPHGHLTGRQTAAVAAVGPGACIVVGTLLAVTQIDSLLAWWFTAHALFLLPMFGDGRNLWRGLVRGHGI